MAASHVDRHGQVFGARGFSRVQRAWPRVWTSVCLFVGMVSVARADPIQIVVPNAYADAEAASSAGSTENIRAQFIFAADQFADLSLGGAYLTSFRWRPDGAILVPADWSYDELTWRASVSQRAPDAMSLVFAENITGPVTIVRATALWKGHTDNKGPPGGPKVFDVDFVLDTPYRYDPAVGNLLLDAVARTARGYLRHDRLAAGEKSEAAVIVSADPASPMAEFYVGAIVTAFTFVHKLEGACCLPDGTCTEPLTEAACTDLGGGFRGPDTSCDGGSICLGACCKGAIGCSETLISECADDFRDYGSTCAQGCPCPDPFADVDLDGDVDQLDFAVLQSCFASPDVIVGGVCLCFDRDPVGGPDGDVDMDDLDKFELCASGPGVPFNPDCDTW